MKKILVAFDGSHYAESALQYGIEFAKEIDGLLVGVFIEDLTFYTDALPFGEEQINIGITETAVKEMNIEVKENIDIYIDQFRSACDRAGVDYQLHRDAGVSVRELLRETTYADLLLIGARTYFSFMGYQEDRTLVYEILRESSCPVIVSPSNYHEVKHNIIAFDGSESAMYAIKQFCYLFSEVLARKETTLLAVQKTKGEELVNANLVLEYIAMHFPKVKLKQLVGEPTEEILHYAGLADDVLLVLGSFGRSFFSRLFKKSVGKKVVESDTVPAFITHK